MSLNCPTYGMEMKYHGKTVLREGDKNDMKIEDFNPRLQAQIREQLLGEKVGKPNRFQEGLAPVPAGSNPARPTLKPLLNKTETRCRDLIRARGYDPILEQAITLRLDPPFKSYRPDLAYVGVTGLTLVEVKAPHRFARAGIAKAALAAKTYPMFRFELFMRTKNGWQESVLSS